MDEDDVCLFSEQNQAQMMNSIVHSMTKFEID